MTVRRFLAGLAASVLGAPGLASACPVCFSAKEGTLEAYYGTTLGLTLLPLLMAAGAGLWFYRRVRAAEGEHVPAEFLEPGEPIADN